MTKHLVLTQSKPPFFRQDPLTLPLNVACNDCPFYLWKKTYVTGFESTLIITWWKVVSKGEPLLQTGLNGHSMCCSARCWTDTMAAICSYLPSWEKCIWSSDLVFFNVFLDSLSSALQWLEWQTQNQHAVSRRPWCKQRWKIAHCDFCFGNGFFQFKTWNWDTIN